MSEPMTPERLQGIKERREAAAKELGEFCANTRGGRRWRMSIPVRPDDSDVLIGNALSDSRDLLLEVARLKALEDEIHAIVDAHRMVPSLNNTCEVTDANRQ